jgi:rhodanese-related sulfurtransferase
VSVAFGQDRSNVRTLLSQHWQWSPPDVQGPMCGIYSTCRALTILGFDVKPDDLWSTKFIGSSKGSSPDELVAAVKKVGGTATIRVNMSYTELLALEMPLIANVRRTPYQKQFDHWVCVINSRDGLRVFDGPQASRVIEPSVFLASWSGVGVIVGDGRSMLVDTTVIRLIWMALLISIAYLILRHRSRTGAASLGTGWVPIAVATVACTVVGNCLYVPGQGHYEAVQLAAAPYRATYVGKATLKDALECGRNESCLLVDARRTEDYLGGSLPNAVSIPVTASYMEIKEFLKAVPRDIRITVFCQSAKCDYNKQVAVKLSQLGFEHVSVADEGFMEFEKLKDGTVSHSGDLRGKNVSHH